jgi:hypothetical protein
MATKLWFYPADSTLDDLSQSCQIDEDNLRSRLINLERGEMNGAKANKATFEGIEFSEPYITKRLLFQDLTQSASDEKPQGYEPVLKADVFLQNRPARIAVYREI